MDGQGRVIAEVKSYAAFLAVLRARVLELDTNYSCINDLAELPDGYLGKLIARSPSRNFGRTSLGSVLAVLGLRLFVATDDEKLRAMRPYYERRKKHACGDASGGSSHSMRFNSGSAAIFAHRRALSLTPQRRREIARVAARARWNRPVR
jgi:hypothetical protein